MGLLEITDLHAGYENIEVLHGISLKVEEKKITTVVGSNGAGKTTMLNSILGVMKPTSGSIILSQEEISGLPPQIVVRKGIALVPEGRQLFPVMTVADNLLLGSYVREARMKRKESFELVYSLFPILKERKKQLASTLSGGQQQMLAVARGLMARPKLLLLDEPSLGIAPFLVDELFAVLKKIAESGQTILLVEQNVKRALTLAEKAYVLENGRIAMQGNGRELLENQSIRQLYLGM